MTIDNCFSGQAWVDDASDYRNPIRPSAPVATPSCATACNPDAPFDAYVPSFTGTATVDGLSFSADGLTAYVSGKSATGNDYDIYVAQRPSRVAAFSPLAPLAGVNTPANERFPSISPDGLRLYMTSRATGWDDIAVATRQRVQDPFSAPAPVPGINSSVHDQDPFWWGGDTLYFSSERPTGAQRDLYVTKLTDTGFSTPMKLNGPVSSPSAEDFAPVVTADGLTLYFSSRRPGLGGDGDGDIWMAKRASLDADFGEPVNLGPLNTTGKEYPVAVSRDGCTLYFASNRDTGLGGTDSFRLYQATRGKTIPQTVTLRLNIVGNGSVNYGPFHCSTGNVGTCEASAPPDSQLYIVGSRQSTWSGTCIAYGSAPVSTDGIVMFTNNGVCTLTFP
jgi:hypothetical protein